MVFLSDIPSTFWGVTLDGSGKKYTQTVKHSFHISMAALEPNAGNKTDGKGDQFVSIMVQQDQAEFMICTLEHGRLYNQPLDLNFLEGEEVTFFLNGKGIVHLTGYLDEDSPEPEDEEDEESEDSDYEPPELLAIDEDEEDSESSEEEDAAKAASGKRKKKADKKQKKKQKLIEMDSDEEDLIESEDEEDEEESEEGNEFLDKEAIEDNEWMDDDDDDDDEEDDEDEDENEISFGGSFIEDKKQKSESKESKKTATKDTPTKKQDQTPSKQSPPVTNGDTSEKKKKKKKKKKKNKNKGEDTPAGTPQSQSKPNTPANSESTQSPQTPASGKKQKVKKQVLEGGLLVEDVKGGHGPEAKPGKMVHVYYKGTLSKTGKVFDSNLTGKPFRFKLGKREVIQGWDSGLKGMKVGGKRRLTIPPKLGYGGQRAGDIPPNSTLVFDVELKAVS